MEGYKYNIIITSGAPIESVTSKADNFYYSYINFANVQTIYNEKSPWSSTIDKSSRPEICEMMQGKKTVLWIPPIAASVSGGMYTSTMNGDLIKDGDRDKYHNLPNGLKTNQGTIINQPFIPSLGYTGISATSSDSHNSIYNTIAMSSDSDGTQQISSQYFPYVWSAVPISATNSSGTIPEGILTGTGALKRTYGMMQRDGLYINNKKSRQAAIDVPIIANRVYSCSSYDKGGSFAFCYDYSNDWTGVDVKKPGQTIDQAPQLMLTISSVLYNDGDKFDNSDAENTGVSSWKNLQTIITIPPDGQITARLAGKFVAQGGFSLPSNDILPPQCKKQGNQMTTKPLFVYPLYSGIVITNSLIKNNNSKSQQVFVKFPFKSDPRKQTRINTTSKGGFNLETVTSQQSNAMKNIQPKYALKWFPSIVQQRNDEDKEEVSLSVHSNFKLELTNKSKLSCIRSLCSFAYCPLFFSKHLQFDLFFKGATKSTYKNSSYVSNSGLSSMTFSDGFKYYLYPIVYDANIYKGGDQLNWEEGITREDQYIMASCITIPQTAGYYDSNLEETIYSARFAYTADRAMRYPLQVFGAMLVLHKSNFDFDILNSNGSFTLSNCAFVSNFTAITSSASICHSKSQLFNLITDCNIQCSLDGVTGSLNLDCYPISQGINTLIREQSIGEIDLDIAFNNSYLQLATSNSSDSSNSSSSSYLINNPNPSIFKGFAMNVETQYSQGDTQLTVNLIGMQKKLQDMKMIAAPFWDGDRLESICAYLQSFANVHLKMISDSSTKVCSSGASALISDFSQIVDVEQVATIEGTWKANPQKLIKTDNSANAVDFRVGRSWNWQSPHLNFTNGTSCLQALNRLAIDTSCVFVIGLDGKGYFYELNKFGYPYYVDNQTKPVVFQLSDIISISLQPQLSSKYNAVATFAFLVKEPERGQDQLKGSVEPGSFFTRLRIKGDGSDSSVTSALAKKAVYPWDRLTLNVQNGYLTKSELLQHHINRIQRSVADFVNGNITVLGNTKVYNIYQVIKINDGSENGVCFFVNSISHSINLSTKTWTTTYGIQYTDIMPQNDNGGLRNLFGEEE